MVDSSKDADRGLCKVCGVNPKAINYKKNGKTFYRSRCNACLKHYPNNALVCTMCGFVAKYPEQLVPVSAAKTDSSVCLNCDVVRKKGRAKLDRLKPVADS